MKSAIILIDCWGYGFDWVPLVPEKKLYKNIINFINLSNADDVILASYDCVNELDSDVVWYKNSKKRLNEKFKNKLDLYHEEFKKLHPNKKPYTVKRLFNLHLKNKNQYSAHFPFELDSYDRVYLCGKAFEKCVTRRPIGINYFKQTNTEILINQNCVLTATSKKPIFDDTWEKVDTDLFKLKNTRDS